MGNAISQTALQDHIKLLSDFSSDGTIDQDDRFWTQLFAFPLSLSSLPPSQLEQRVSECCGSLGEQTPSAGNIRKTCQLSQPELLYVLPLQ